MSKEVLWSAVFITGGLMSWAHFSTILEPYNYHREIIGFDTFEGFPDIAKQDGSGENARKGAFSVSYDSFSEITSCISEFDENRFINEKRKISLVKGDANSTIPKYLSANQHLLVSLLYLDFDIYQPTVTALKHLLPRISKGGIIAFDEAHNPDWPGETIALLEQLDASLMHGLLKLPLRLACKSVLFDPINRLRLEVGARAQARALVP